MNGILKMFIACLFLAMAPIAGADVPQFDHRYPAWNQVLQEFVKDDRVDYEVLKNNPAQLNAFLQSISHLPKDEYEGWSREQKISFWINTYNALAIKVILDYYPLKKGLSWKALAFPKNSIQQIPNVWDRDLIKIFNEDFSLNRIEHEILLKEFKEPRIHFALVCASLGCPVLRSKPFAADKLHLRLEDQTSRFLADPKKFRYDPDTDTLYLSPIFKWFKKDFEQTGGIISFIKQYGPQNIASDIPEKSKIEWLSYDWSLNKKQA